MEKNEDMSKPGEFSKGDFLLGSLISFVFLFAIFEAFDYKTRFFLLLIMIPGLLLSIIVTVLGFVKGNRQSIKNIFKQADKSLLAHLGWVTGFVAVSVLLGPYLGILIVSILFLIWSREKIYFIIGLPVGFLILLYGLQNLFNILLPKGLLF